MTPSRVAFGIGGASHSIKSYGVPNTGSSNSSAQGSALKSKLLSRHSLSDLLLIRCCESLHVMFLQAVLLPQA